MTKLDREIPKHETVMDVTEEQIARVYAQAFLGVAFNSPNTDDLVEEFTSLVSEVLDRFPKLEKTLRSSLISPEQKEQLLNRIFGKRVSSEVLNFLKVLSRHGRLSLLRSIARLVKKLHAQRRGMTDVEVRVATKLDDSLRDEIQRQLRKSLGREPILNVRIDPSLIAGMVVRVGDRVYDGSVHSQLERARQAMIERATEQIETKPERFMSAG